MRVSKFKQTNPLCVHLVDVGKSLCKNITRHFISEFVLELRSLALCSSNLCSTVGYRASYDTSNRWGNLEDMGYGGWFNELVLYSMESVRKLATASDHHGAQFRLVSYLYRTGTFFWDIITAQFLPRIPSDVIFAAVMALKAYSKHT